MRFFLWLAILWTLPAAASDFGARHPAGSIRDEVQAQVALKDADAEMARIGQSALSDEAACYRRFFVNSCRDIVRREKELAEREVKRVQLEAHDLQRRLDAEDVARRRAADARTRAAEDAQRPQREEAARAASQAREADLKPQSQGEAAQRDRSGALRGDDRQPSLQDRLSTEERAENVRRYQQKQAQAEKRAQEKEAERKKNEQRRAEKHKETERREAEREAVRQKAAQALK